MIWIIAKNMLPLHHKSEMIRKNRPRWGGWVAETTSLLNWRRSNPTTSSNLVLTAINGSTTPCGITSFFMVPWPSGEATVCKTVYSSSILLGTSLISVMIRFWMQVLIRIFFCCIAGDDSGCRRNKSIWGQRIFPVGTRRCQEYSVASLNIKNLMSPTPRNCVLNSGQAEIPVHLLKLKILNVKV